MSQLLKSIHFSKFQPNIVRLLSSFSTKGTVKPNNPNNQNADLLVANLQESHTLDDVFSLVNTHYSIMNNHHIMEALKTLFTLQKQESNSKSAAKQILRHPGFEQLCSKLKSFAGIMGMDDALDALKVLTYLNVPSNSTIYQTMLQLLRHDINNLSINQLMFFGFLLRKVEKTPLSEALKLALPIVFETQVPVKLDLTNVRMLADCLSFSSKNNVSRPCVELIVNALLKQRLINEKLSMSILWSLCDLPPADYYEPLLKKAIKNLTINAYKVKFEELETTLTKLTFRYSVRHPFYYNQEFFDLCGEYILKNDTGFEHAVHFLRKVLKTDYFHQTVFDYAVDLCHKNPDLLAMGDPSHVYSLVCTAALTDYRSDQLDRIKDGLLDFETSKFEEKENLLRYATSMCIIGVYSPRVLQKVLDAEYLETVYRKRFVHDVENILLISQLIKTYKPELIHLLPPDQYLRQFRNCIKLVNDFPLKGLLHKVFGGENFVRTNVYSKMHYCIDHVIVLRKGGFPLPIDKPNMELEDITIDPYSQMVLIIVLPPQHYTLRAKRIKGSTAAFIKILEDKGYNVVTIDLDLWKRCPEFEKVPYVMEQIKQKTDYLEKLSNFL